MQTFSFEIVLADQLPKVTKAEPEHFEYLAEKLFEAGCDDALPTVCEGIVTVGFDREAASLGAAIDSAVRDIHRAGFKAAKVFCEELPELASA